MKNIIIVLIVLTFSDVALCQLPRFNSIEFRFKNENSWKRAHKMIDLTDTNCEKALEIFEILNSDSLFKHPGSYLAIAKCYFKNGQPEFADSILVAAYQKGAFKKQHADSNLISHPKISERLVLMYMEDQGAWSIKDQFIIDPEVRESFNTNQIDFEDLTKKVRKRPGNELHKLHVEELESIIREYGFPTQEMVGEIAMNGVKYVILHSSLETLLKYKKDYQYHFGMKSMAYLIDKQLTAISKNQLYGTQGDFDKEGKLIFYPIEDEVNVNKRRMAAGMMPIELYAKKLGIQNYKIPVHNNR